LSSPDASTSTSLDHQDSKSNESKMAVNKKRKSDEHDHSSNDPSKSHRGLDQPAVNVSSTALSSSRQDIFFDSLPPLKVFFDEFRRMKPTAGARKVG
jgi:hypothetical protein